MRPYTRGARGSCLCCWKAKNSALGLGPEEYSQVASLCMSRGVQVAWLSVCLACVFSAGASNLVSAYLVSTCAGRLQDTPRIFTATHMLDFFALNKAGRVTPRMATPRLVRQPTPSSTTRYRERRGFVHEKQHASIIVHGLAPSPLASCMSDAK